MGDQSIDKRFLGCGMVIVWHPVCNIASHNIGNNTREGVCTRVWILVVMRDIYNFMDIPIDR